MEFKTEEFKTECKLYFFLVFRWVSNLDIKWKTPNLKITTPEQFEGKDLEEVEKHPRLIEIHAF